MIAWIDEAMRAWDEGLSTIDDLESQRPCHWGATAPLRSIVMMAAYHLTYHAGELNMLLEVEENHIDTFGHGVRRPWMTDDIARYYEDRIRAARESRQRA